VRNIDRVEVQFIGVHGHEFSARNPYRRKATYGVAAGASDPDDDDSSRSGKGLMPQVNPLWMIKSRFN
jgi:hypothetical protein